MIKISIMFRCWIIVLPLIVASCTTNTKPYVEVKRIRNVILVIGDGMGPQQIGLLLAYARLAPHGILKSKTTAFDALLEKGRLGLSLTHAAGTLVTDSGASASQLATGHSAGTEMIGLDQLGNSQETVVEMARKMGKATGLVSDTRITHATPAAFAAHQRHRSLENEIALDLLAIEPDVMLSAGLANWLPKSITDLDPPYVSILKGLERTGKKLVSYRLDDKDLLSDAVKKGYGLAFDTQQMIENDSNKLLGLFADSAMMSGLLETKFKNDPDRTMPTLTEMTSKALNVLSRNKNGFFLMVEAGQIDWAGHSNDTGMLLHEMLKINEVINEILKWMDKRDDTLIIVTADHETGGFGFSYSGANIPKPAHLPGAFFSDQLFQPTFPYGSPEILDKIYNQNLTYAEIFSLFDHLPQTDKNPDNLTKIVNDNTRFPITKAQAEKILAAEPNPLYIPGHKSLGEKNAAVMGANNEFFVYQKANRQNLLARAVAVGQQAVWSTGTHTSTPVTVFGYGPEYILPEFNKIFHHTDLGLLIKQILSND